MRKSKTKVCRDCGRRKPVEDFTFDSTPGYYVLCVECRRKADEAFEDWERDYAWAKATAIDPEWPAGENGYPALNP